ncbi:hypothetical protein GCM10025877_23190 [Agromyces mangrovi Wang et al. 2018]|nr:hypothetical protein GCM10025877_23190 [Agromyces mangrovi]
MPTQCTAEIAPLISAMYARNDAAHARPHTPPTAAHVLTRARVVRMPCPSPALYARPAARPSVRARGTRPAP